MGDTSSLWVGLKHCHVDLTNADSPPSQKLHQTLSLKKLKFLDHLYLACSGENCIETLRMVARDHPAIRKLTLEVEWMKMTEKTQHRMSNALVKFDEVDLTNCNFFAKCWNTNGYDSDGNVEYLSNPDIIDKDMTGLLMKTLLYESTHQTGSKLKIITFCGECIEAAKDDDFTFNDRSYRCVIFDYEEKYDIEVNLEYRTAVWETDSEEEDADSSEADE